MPNGVTRGSRLNMVGFEPIPPIRGAHQCTVIDATYPLGDLEAAHRSPAITGEEA